MKHYRFYFYTAISLSILYILIASITTPYFLRLSTVNVLSSEIEASQQQARLLAKTSEHALNSGMKKDALIESIQSSIDHTDEKNIFNSIINWSGRFVCYPDITIVGTEAPQGNNAIGGIENELSGEALYTMLFNSDTSTGTQSEIIHMTPVKNSDWIIACHVNKSNVVATTHKLRQQLYIIFLIIALITLVFVLGSIRLISSYYETQLELKSTKIEDGVLNLTKLNASLENYQKNLSDFKKVQDAQVQESEVVSDQGIDIPKEIAKQRILTYVRNELLPIATEDISYIYVDNTITYVVRKDGKRSTTSESLDQIYTYLDKKAFFRANRQIIVAISAIDKITKFGNSKLKIQVLPISEIDIVIGKNKAAAFKQWLDL